MSKVEIECEFKTSEKCKNKYLCSYSNRRKILEKNNGKIICSYCSRRSKYSGRNNPNCKHKNVLDNYFENIDNEEKAYILGWIASDGHLGKNNAVVIAVERNDIKILEFIRDKICSDINIKEKLNEARLTFCSRKIVLDICGLLKISPGKKSHCVNFPDLENNELKFAFLRGYFDGDGCVCLRTGKWIRADIKSNSKNILTSIKEFVNIKCGLYENRVVWFGKNALEFLSKIYDNANFYLERKYNKFNDFRRRNETKL